jgi:hypothetical protein
MEDLLPTMLITVDDEPVTVFSDPFLFGQLLSHQQNSAGNLFIFFS